MLELKLQGFCDEIKNIDFDNINKHVEDLVHNNSKIKSTINKSSNLLIQNNNNIMNYVNINNNTKDNINLNDYTIPLESVSLNINTDIKNSTVTDKVDKGVLINQILNLNVTKGEEMAQFIESLLLKTESDMPHDDTVRILEKK